MRDLRYRFQMKRHFVIGYIHGHHHGAGEAEAVGQEADAAFERWYAECGPEADAPVQHQSSLLDQLKELIPIAERTGLYDAADFLKNKCKC